MDGVERAGRRGGVGRRRGPDGQHQSAQEARRGVRGAVSGRAGPPPEEGAEVNAEVNEVERMAGTAVPGLRDTTDPVDPVEAADPVETVDPVEAAEEPTDAVGSPGSDPRLPGARSGSRRTGGSADSRDRAAARDLFVSLRALPDGSPERAELRDRLVRMHLPLVEHLARRFRNRGEPLDDLTQVATIGLIKSVDRFDPERGVEFSTYATPTVVGEIKRHFRDKGWAVRVPRRLQELRLSLSAATAELSQLHGRAPTVHELAERLNTSEEEVLEGLESANAYSTLSLDVPDTDDESPAVADTLGAEDDALEGVEYRESLKPLLEELPPREKKILMLRFFGNMTQSQIAQEVGISQMHVSRLLARTLAQLREKLLVEE
ncbi:SigB/SigF/SigG family RNA polymerase sigma factor [Streptomyces calidiresistens]|uniref:SigB/SigF/SigG family RNA polymerase sigma factor n=1 Tax=Streptomyces calidiresistens TaxID=1485586 RepID=A0A7W3XXX9_9ACTN|nr:RNA polymerase sigma factor SigF [Streptomyces calidiresistens]MBB0231292.1 SigB/SigF/SigG family RNA polymerase sigma factor [Streptomyces calidiresistens]